MEFTLDYSKWRCGSNGINKLGDGWTYLLNPQGYQCCIGQFSSQIGYTKSDLMEVGSPTGSSKVLDDEDIFTSLTVIGKCNTPLTRRAISINDEESTTPQQKIEALQQLFSEHGHSITVINQP